MLGDGVRKIELRKEGDNEFAYCRFKNINLNKNFDLVIGADGPASKVRDLIWDPKTVKRGYPG